VIYIRKSEWMAAATIIAYNIIPAAFLLGPTLFRLLLPFHPAFVTGSLRQGTSGSGFEHNFLGAGECGCVRKMMMGGEAYKISAVSNGSYEATIRMDIIDQQNEVYDSGEGGSRRWWRSRPVSHVCERPSSCEEPVGMWQARKRGSLLHE
jgi:hypothetical protein